eukprot:TRINITY_DN8623_c0_g1_i5.p1 TRINITY_DN8623_c0_g1~~TRINITY_DN8623_c0_g1_i5.p1  ORF type:complete len:235 (-),score=31.29 TRINITY_DN8623_c0_g1_i5:77-781(-)
MGGSYSRSTKAATKSSPWCTSGGSTATQMHLKSCETGPAPPIPRCLQSPTKQQVANACRMVCFFSKQKSSKGIHHTATDQQLTAAEAQGYLESGAKAGHPPCQARLAKSKETTDPEGSHDLYVLAAHHQWAFAENAVGTYNYTLARKAREAGNYSHAEIWSQHAAEWFSKAALQGNAYGQNNLARCYERGEGVVLDLGKAQKFYSLSAAQGWQDAVTNLARVNAKIHHHQNNKQ